MVKRSLQFEAIGTHWQIDVDEQVSDGQWMNVQDAIHSRIEEFDTHYSRFRVDSLVSQMAKTGGTFQLPTDAKELFDLYYRLYTLTDGSFTPLIGNLLADSGYDATYSFTEKPLRTPSRWEDVLSYTYPELTIAKDEILDFGAGGKGYLIDIVGGVLRQQGILNFCIDAGGDILHSSAKKIPLRIGLENPRDVSQAIGVASVCNQSITGSSGNRRKWGKHHHIFNPHTKESTNDVLATWVIAPTALVADAVATCLFFVSPETLRSVLRFDYLILYPDNSIVRSENFTAELFLE